MRDVIRPCVLPKSHASMPRLMMSNHLCCQREMITCHARRNLIMYALLGRLWHVKPDIIRPRVHSKGDDGIATDDVVQQCVLPKGHDVMQRPT